MKKISIECWPRGLTAELAAAYVGLSKSGFLEEVRKKEAPEPTWITKRRKVWLREKLDNWLERKDCEAKGIRLPEPWD